VIYDGVELPKLLTIDEAAKVLGIDCEKISELIKTRRLATMRVNGEIRIITESIEDRRKGSSQGHFGESERQALILGAGIPGTAHLFPARARAGFVGVS